MFHALVESSKALRHLDGHRSRNTVHWQNLAAQFGSRGSLTAFSDDVARHLVDNDLLYATDDGKSLCTAPESLLPKIDFKQMSDSNILATAIVDRHNEIRPSVEGRPQFDVVRDGIAKQIAKMESAWAVSTPDVAAA